MPRPEFSVEETIDRLNIYEKKVLTYLGKKCISKHKNIRLETIKDELPNKYGKNVNKALQNLHTEGLVFKYRHKNYGLSAKGVIVAQQLKEDFRKKRYGDLKILILV